MEDGGGNRVVRPSVEEKNEVLGSPRIFVQIDVFLVSINDGEVGLDIGDVILRVENFNDWHFECLEVDWITVVGC